MEHIILESSGEAIGTIEQKNNGYCASCFLAKNSTFVSEKKMAESFVLETYKKLRSRVKRSGVQLILF